MVEILETIYAYSRLYPAQIFTALLTFWAFINRDKAGPVLAGVWSKLAQYIPGKQVSPATEDIAAKRQQAFDAYLVLHNLLKSHEADPKVIAALESVLPCVVHIEAKHEVAGK